MNITVKVRKLSHSDSKLKAIASIVIDESLIINDIKVYRHDGNYNISFPNTSRASALGKQNIVPIGYKTRQRITKLIVQELKKT